MKKEQTIKQSILKPVYLTALFPLVSTALYLALMGLSTTEDFGFTFFGVLGFLAVTAAWGFVGSLFARTKNLMLPSVLIANAIPILTTIVYTVLYIIAQVMESESLEGIAELIGTLGTGLFGVLGTWLYALIPLYLFEPYINFVFSILVFIVGYSIGASHIGNKKKSAK